MHEFSNDEVLQVLRSETADRLEELGTSRTASAMQAVVLIEGEVVLDEALGHARFGPDRPLRANTPMDVASLTKLFTATIAAQAVDEGLVSWSTPVAELVGGWEDDGAPATLLHVLNHSSGLPAWEKFYLRYPLDPTTTIARETRDAVLDEIVRAPRREAGRFHAYSDLGYILLGRILEKLFDRGLAELVEERIFEPLGMSRSRYVSIFRQDRPLTDAVATEACPLRGRVVVGTVHDENCNIQGGVAGHAGAFSTARDIAAFGQHMLDIENGTASSPLLVRDTLLFCWSDEARGAEGHHLGGWDTPSGPRSSAGRGFDPDATVGHLGFTGTSLWIDRSKQVVAALLTNRVYPSRENGRIKDLRVRFHESVIPGK